MSDSATKKRVPSFLVLGETSVLDFISVYEIESEVFTIGFPVVMITFCFSLNIFHCIMCMLNTNLHYYKNEHISYIDNVIQNGNILKPRIFVITFI